VEVNINHMLQLDPHHENDHELVPPQVLGHFRCTH
jgi:hypothetical protein